MTYALNLLCSCVGKWYVVNVISRLVKNIHYTSIEFQLSIPAE